MRPDTIFKYGVSLVLIVEFCILLGMMYVSVTEYSGTGVEPIGLVIVFISVVVVSVVMLSSVYQVLKQKSLQT